MPTDQQRPWRPRLRRRRPFPSRTLAVPASPGSPAGSAAAATADPKPEAEADWLASMGKRFPPVEKK